MIAIDTIIAIFAVCFILAFVTKRRYGILGLGLIAGTILSGLFGAYGSYLVSAYAHWAFTPNLADVPPMVTAAVVLTLAPAFLLLISGPKYRKGRAAIVSSLAFAITALLLIMGQSVASFGGSQTLATITQTAHAFFPFVIVGVVIVSVIDIIMGHGPSFKPPSRH